MWTCQKKRKKEKVFILRLKFIVLKTRDNYTVTGLAIIIFLFSVIKKVHRRSSWEIIITNQFLKTFFLSRS
jgi:hypothetical protein